MSRSFMLSLVLFLIVHISPTTFAQSEVVLGEGRQPQVAIGPAGETFVVHAKDGKVQVHACTDAGQTYGDAVLVDTVAGLPLGMRRGPRIAATEGSVVITAISGEKGGGKDGDVFAWVSHDNAKTWKKIGKAINSASGSAREGMHGMAGGTGGMVACVWLDMRNVKPGKPGTEVWCAVSRDGGKTWPQDRLVYRNAGATVCECCHPSVVIDDKGVITVMFRNAVAGARDMYITSSKDGGKTFSAARKLGLASWSLNACPMDGGALAMHGDSLHTIWRRDRAIYTAVAGKSEQLVAQGTQPVIAGTTQGLYAIWMTGTSLMWQGPGQGATVLTRSGSFPAIASAPDGKGPVVAAWERDGKVVVRTMKDR